MVWEEDSISSLEQSKSPPEEEEQSFEGELSTSSLSCDDEKYEAFSLSVSRRGSTDSVADDSIDRFNTNVHGKERLPWWRPSPLKQQQQEPSHDTCCEEEHDASSDSSEELQNAPQSVSETASADAPDESSDREHRPLGWWKLSFRRKSTSERSNTSSIVRRSSIHSSSTLAKDSGSSAAPTPSLTPHTPSIDGEVEGNVHVDTKSSEEELNRLLFPRRGSFVGNSVFSQNSHPSNPRRSGISTTSSHSLLDTSQESHDTIDNVVRRHGAHLNSVERALLADIVHHNENRWKKPVNTTATTILEEEASSLRSDDSRKKDTPTVATMVETQMSPGSDFALGKQPDANSWSSDENADEDGLYCNWSVVGKDPIQNYEGTNDKTCNTLPDALPTIHDSVWDTEQLLKLKDGVSLARINVIDDVSSIVSSEHSGKITTGSSKGNRLSHKQSNRLSLTLGNLKGSFLVSKSKMSTRASAVMGDYEEEEEEDRLEDELFAVGDAKHAKIVKDAMALMDIVNKSVISMGMVSPFRCIDEVSLYHCWLRCIGIIIS